MCYHGHRDGYDGYKVKTKVPIFNGSLDMEAFLDWLNEVESFTKLWRLVKNVRLK